MCYSCSRPEARKGPTALTLIQTNSGLPQGPSLGSEAAERAVKRLNGPVGALIGIGEEVPMLDIKRREFIALVGGGGLLLTAKVRRARAQQPAVPVIGFLHSTSLDATP